MTSRIGFAVKLAWLISLMFIGLSTPASLADRGAPTMSQEVPYKDFDVVPTSLDANGFRLNPRWGRQVRYHTLPSPKQSCPLSDEDASHWTSAPQFPNCTSHIVRFNGEIFPDSCLGGHHVNFMTVTYQGTLTWKGTGPRPWDDDYTFNVDRDDEALYCVENPTVHAEFDARETVDQWDGTGTWWESFHNAVDKGGFRADGLINGHSAVVVGLLGIDTAHDGKPELHPVYAMFVRTNQNWKLQSSWAFFVRNWGNEGYCGGNQMKMDAQPLKIQIPRAAQILSSNIRMGARNSHDFSSMRMDVQPNPGGLELRFTLLQPEKQSWIVGDLSFQELPVKPTEPEDDIGPQFEALRVEIEKLPDASRKKLFAQLQSAIPKGETGRLPVNIIAVPAQLGSPRSMEPQSDQVRSERDFLGEVNRRRQFDVLESFFRARGIRVNVPRER
jgi:hypothetical protein